MTPQERFNRVQIIEEAGPDRGVRDDRGRPIQHSIAVVRMGDGMTLAKYRDKEIILDPVEQKLTPAQIAKGEKPFTKLQELEISGIEAAERCCATNGWLVAEEGSLSSGKKAKSKTDPESATEPESKTKKKAKPAAAKKKAAKPGAVATAHN